MHPVRFKGKKTRTAEKCVFNRFASKLVCIEKGHGEKVCIEAIVSESPVSLEPQGHVPVNGTLLQNYCQVFVIFIIFFNN